MSTTHWMSGGDLNPAGFHASAPMPGVVQSNYGGGRNGEPCTRTGIDAITLAAAKTHKTWERPSGIVRGGYG